MSNPTAELANGFIEASGSYIQQTIDEARSNMALKSGLNSPAIITSSDDKVYLQRFPSDTRYHLPRFEQTTLSSRLYLPVNIGLTILRATFDKATEAAPLDEMHFLGIIKDARDETEHNVVAPILIDLDTHSEDDKLSLVEREDDEADKLVEGIWLDIGMIPEVLKNIKKNVANLAGTIGVNSTVATVLRYYYNNDTEEVSQTDEQELVAA